MYIYLTPKYSDIFRITLCITRNSKTKGRCDEKLIIIWYCIRDSTVSRKAFFGSSSFLCSLQCGY
jgi:hypothetical protein